MKSLWSGLLLIAVGFVNISFQGDIENNDGTIIGRYKTKIIPEVEVQRPFHRLVVIDAQVLENVLTSKSPFKSMEENHTKSFFSEFKNFLIPFDWNDEKNNNVIKLTAEYNNKYFTNNSDESIHLWISFKPKKDISDDIDQITSVLLKTNLIYPKTVVAIVLSYGLLELDGQSLVLVNHEILKMKQKLEKLSHPERLIFALQLDSTNCRNRVEYIQRVDLGMVDVLLLISDEENSIPQSEQDILAAFYDKPCLPVLLLTETLPALDTHISIKINLEKAIYEYNPAAARLIEVGHGPHFANNNLNRTLYVFYAAVDKESRNSRKNERVRTGETDPKLINWLEQPIEFNRQYYGAIISSMEHITDRVSGHFRKILIETYEGDSDKLKNLPGIITLLSNISNPTNKVQEPVPYQISLLVVFSGADFQANKVLVDKAVSAVVSSNQMVPGIINAVMLDWIPCTHSKVCVGNMDKNVSSRNYCSYFEMGKDMADIYNYTKTALFKASNASSINVGAAVDTQIVPKLTEASVNNKCGGYMESLISTIVSGRPRACKGIVLAEDIRQNGATAVYDKLTADLNQCDKRLFPPSSHASLATNFYVKLVGCNRSLINISDLAEIAAFYKRLNKWASESKVPVYIDAGIERPGDCQQEKGILPEYRCTCGWWVEKESILESKESADTILDKKKLALQLYRNKWSSRSSTKQRSVNAVSNVMLVTILSTLLLISVFIVVVALFLMHHYRSKYLLTNEEMENFLKGRLQTSESAEGRPHDGNDSAQSEKYNSDKYEIGPSSFTIDKSACLGSGEFGKVFRGTIQRNGTKSVTAVKVANAKALSKSHGGCLALNGLLSEIKILSYLGLHDHIVTLLGAYTAKLRKGDIVIFLELCELGSLDKYLRSIKPQPAVDENDDVKYDIPMMTIMTIQDTVKKEQCALPSDMREELYGYAGQIACGMEYLSSKNLVHADLASRNVLLTRDKIAKISDFGLSRRLYDYTEYVKQNHVGLPWRWMAPESLRRLVFNEKTDVWAFGVTLWEIFTLGDEPYPGLSWNGNFPAMLNRGLQLPAPRYNVKQIHSVMRRCWNIDPVLRPTFAGLYSELNGMQTDGRREDD